MSAMNEEAIEQAIQDKHLTSPRIAPSDIDAKITHTQYYVFPGTTVTVCALTLINGYVVTGMSASVSPENFDAEIGQSVARAEARDKIWELEGYLLKQTLHINELVRKHEGE